MGTQDWDQSNRRHRLVTELTLDRGCVSEELAADVVAEFGTWEHALQAVHRRWVALVSRCLHAELETGGYDDAAVVLARAARRAVADSPALHRTVERWRDDPVVAGLDRRFHLQLARSFGIGDPAEVGRIFARAAAAGHASRPPRRPWRGLVVPRGRRAAGSRSEGPTNV